MSFIKIHGSSQIKDNTIVRNKLISNFLNGTNWNINGDSPLRATITNIPLPINNDDVANKLYVDNVIGTIKQILFFDNQIIGNGITGIINGVNNIFELANVPDLNSTHVYINGLIQVPGIDNQYTLNGNQLIFNSWCIPEINDFLLVNYRVTA